jgi:hypothetical protein
MVASIRFALFVALIATLFTIATPVSAAAQPQPTMIRGCTLTNTGLSACVLNTSTGSILNVVIEVHPNALPAAAKNSTGFVVVVQTLPTYWNTVPGAIKIGVAPNSPVKNWWNA